MSESVRRRLGTGDDELQREHEAEDRGIGPALTFAATARGDSLFATLDLAVRQRNENVVLLLALIEAMYGPDRRFDEIRRRMGLVGSLPRP